MPFSMSNNITELNMLISSVGLTQEPTFVTIMYNNVNDISTALLFRFYIITYNVIKVNSIF